MTVLCQHPLKLYIVSIHFELDESMFKNKYSFKKERKESIYSYITLSYVLSDTKDTRTTQNYNVRYNYRR